MANMFGVSVITPSPVGVGAAAAIIRAPASPAAGSRPRIRRVSVVVHANPTQTAIDVYRVPAGNMGTANVSVLGQGYQFSDVSGTNIDTGWSAAPTLPGGAVRIDGCTLLGTVGNGAILQFLGDMVLDVNYGLMLWSTLAGATLRINAVWEE